MANTVQIKRGNNTSVNAHTGPSGELIYNLDTGRLHAQDGSTAGGNPHALVSDVDLKANADVNIIAGDGLTGGGTLAANRTLALSSASIASLSLADTAVQSVNGKTGPSVTLTKADVGLSNVDNTSDASKPISTATQTALNAKANSSVTVSTGTGLTGGGNLAANRTVALNAASVASLAKADTALQAPGGAAGQILAKSSNTTNDVAWVSSEAATAVSYAPQTLTPAQQEQAQDNIGLSLTSSVRPVAYPTRLAQVIGDAGETTANSRQAVRAVGRIDGLSLVYCGWVVNSVGGENDASPITVSASIEYPRGAMHQVKFSGGNSVVVPSGGTVQSDSLDIRIPDGATFWVRTHQNAGAGRVIYSRPVKSSNRDWNTLELGSSLSDKTMGGEIEGTTIWGYGPVAIVGQSDRTAVAILGDSRSVGSNDDMDGSLALGNIARSLDGKAAYIHMGVGGERLDTLAGSCAKRSALMDSYCTHAVLASGINDLTNGATLAQLSSRMEDVLGQLTLPTYICTIEPRTSSTDEWATIGNQSFNTDHAARTAFNDRIRSGYFTDAAGYFDLADAVESSRNSGFWAVNGSSFGFTIDGTHASPNGYRRQADQRPVAAEKLTTPLQRAIRPIEPPISGDFTPSVFGSIATPGTCTYQYQDGKYQKIGNMVFFQLSVRWDGHTGTGGLRIELNIPFENAFLTGPTPGSAMYTNIPHDADRALTPVIRQIRTPTMVLYQPGQTGSPITVALPAAGVIYGISGFYFTD